MPKQYQWRTAMLIYSGGYPGEDANVDPEDTGWRTTDVMSGSSSAKYYYRDSDAGTNDISSKVTIDITESWTASINNRNQLTIVVSTTINSIVRDDIRGNIPSTTLGRNIFIRREEGGANIWTASNDPIYYAHTILGSPLDLGTQTFVLEPGGGNTKSSIYIRNNTVGHDYDPIPSGFVDAMGAGTEFMNILPADYRPGKILNNSSAWLSHNRSGGAANIRGNNGWIEMRTVGGGEYSDNSPFIRHTSGWKNMREIGLDS